MADAEAVARVAVDLVVDAAFRSVAERARFTLALAGGSTPRRLYQFLASAPFRERVGWDRTHVFFGDERHVPPDHPDSNYRTAREALLDHVAVASVHRMRGEDPDAAAAAASYEAELHRFFGLATGDPPPPLDLVLLGLGPDGHTASLFPGSAALDERSRWVVAPFVRQLYAYRVTLTLPVLVRAREVLFLVSGAAKADALARVVSPVIGDALPPAARVRPETGAPVWIADREAASRVPKGLWGTT
ncbi:MAG TPA: 6-phosphogluconolactonase [Anaeromyxobacter sp.]